MFSTYRSNEIKINQLGSQPLGGIARCRIASELPVHLVFETDLNDHLEQIETW